VQLILTCEKYGKERTAENHVNVGAVRPKVG